jgi:methyltransferase (TIGR00027 family)
MGFGSAPNDTPGGRGPPRGLRYGSPMTPSTELTDISDTALWVAAYRAEESERSDALFQDPYARRLAGEKGFALLDAMKHGRRYAWPMVVRTVMFDQLVLDRVAEGADIVVNLAAGLDARPYRMLLPPQLVWIEVDLPAMIDYKSEILAAESPVCSLERIGLDLAEPAARQGLLRELGRRGRSLLVITEGLIVYLRRDEVTALATELAAEPSYRWWATDLASPALLKMMARTWGSSVARAGAPFQFAPQEGPAFFTALGWRPLAVHSAFKIAARLGRLPWPLRLFALFPEPKKFNPKRVWSGFCLLERAPG